jgi:hypothetical protein
MDRGFGRTGRAATAGRRERISRAFLLRGRWRLRGVPETPTTHKTPRELTVFSANTPYYRWRYPLMFFSSRLR